MLNKHHEDAMPSKLSKSGWSSYCRLCYEAKYGKQEEEGMKRCNKCEEVKSVEEFHKHSKTRDGLQLICKACKRAFDRKRFARIKG